ncbi:MAG: PTS sugar transporter subunit IIC [Lachnospiraceae bacterium]|jgi:PTS system cellobiose-specific IIC component|nr:PTS sugar transporter subunit IIC [Lachnospiraceae bacterium]
MDKKKNKGFFEKISDGIMNLAEPIGKFAQLPAIAAIQEGLIALTPVIIIGSIFLIIGLLGTNQMTTNGEILIPFLAPLSGKIMSVNSYTMGFMGLYAAYTVANSYGEKLGIDARQAGLAGLVSFFAICFVGAEVDTAFFGSSALFVAMIVSLVAVKIYAFFIKKNITIKLPDSVPPSIGKAFVSLIPMSVIIVLCWTIRTMIGFNLAEFLMNMLTPLINGADTLPVFIVIMLLIFMLWAVGLNGPGMLSAVTGPIFTTALANNAASKLAGTALPNVATQSFIFSYMWIASVWPVIFWLFVSKSKGNKAIAVASTPALFFNIIEPCMFSTPVALNGYLMLPFIVSGLMGTTIPYILTKIGFLGAFYAELPWATPPVISGIVGSGDVKALIIQALVLILGIVIYAPFFRMFEQAQAKETAQNNK